MRLSREKIRSPEARSLPTAASQCAVRTDRALRLLGAAPWVLALGFVLIGMAGFTGSSWLVVWRGDGLLRPDERGAREIYGQSRGIRSDEWAVDLPVARAQQLATPTYPLVNRNLGLGHLQRNPYDVPVLDWGIAFRPIVWFLLGPGRWAHGMRWFLRSAIAVLGIFLWMRAVADAGAPPDRWRRAIAAVGAIAVFFTSGVSWWLSTVLAQMVGFSGLAIAAAARGAVAPTRARRWVWTAAAGYLATCAFFFFYPPVWGPLLWILVAAIVDLHARRERSFVRGAWRSAPMVALVATGVVVSIVYYAPYLALVAETLYPGRRVAAAGEAPLSRLVDMVWPSLQVIGRAGAPERYLGRLETNVCEASAVEAFPLFFLAALCVASARVRAAATRAIRANPASFAVWALLLAWLFVRLPEAVGTVTLLRWSPWFRVLYPFGVLSGIVSVGMLAELSGGARARFSWPSLGVAAAFLGAAFFAARGLLAHGSRPFWFPMLLTAAIALAAAALVGRASGALLVALAWAVPLVVADVAVNPLVRSRDLFLPGAGHAEIARALRSAPGRVLDYGTHPGSYLAAYGFPVLASVEMVPDRYLFQFLAPDAPGLTREVYDRYAHVSFALPPEPTRVVAGDAFRVAISPCSARLAALGVNHVLTAPDRAIPIDCREAFERRSAGDLVLWSRRAPVSLFGAWEGDTAPASAVDFDFTRTVEGAAALPSRDGLTLVVPPKARAAYAYALNLELVDEVRCENARAAGLDAHVVIWPTGAGAARCELRFLGSAGALRRLAGAPPVLAPVRVTP